MSSPLVSISLVTYQGRRWLPGCVDSVLAQSLDDLELAVLDNGSRDGSVAWLRERAATEPRMQVRERATNAGYAAGHNENLRWCRGRYVLLLNQDVELAEGFLTHAVAALADRPGVAAVQGRLLRLGAGGERTDTIDTTGLVMARDRRVSCRGQGQGDGPRFAAPGPVWGADGPAPLFRREALHDARLPRTGGGWEILDEDFDTWKEDVDLAWRLRRLGWEAWYEPRALAWHARGTGGTVSESWFASARSYRAVAPVARALSWRNQRLAQVKNDPLPAYLANLPWTIRRELVSLALSVALDPGRLRAFPALLRALPAAMRKRRVLQRRIAARRPRVR